MNFPRTLDLDNLLKKKSFFLFGPRATGKSWLIKESLGKNALVLNLLQSKIYTRLLNSPSDLEGIVKAASDKKLIVIDEIQKIPALLDEVHNLMEETRHTFLLTGSSARKLRRGGVNLLGGRAWTAELFPLTWYELGDKFDLIRYLEVGGLPAVYMSDEPDEELYAYVQSYLKEEILEEALTRNLTAFSRFLKVVSISDGQMINYTEIGNDAQVPPSTVREYFSILEDTLIGFSLPAWTASKNRKAVQTSKFFLFDTGVSNALREVEVIPRNSELFGLRFEHFFAMEIRSYLSYNRIRAPLAYWRSVNGQEVDFLVGNQAAIEIKATKNVSKRHFKGLQALKEEQQFENYFLVSNDSIATEYSGIKQLYWKDFLKLLWEGKIVKAMR